ncbi:Rpp14/Pop5 family protein [Methanobacterium aggregans]|uniref:Rpp14/Pop5 family protein n=1 Tax=Methanobacterium aggregans TaxID=1615586 RepID=UPI001AE9C2F1|nr:Rpp14/Pop5 family protein [Methanobacterium aggregans]MBP2045533.1 ribonuclease P/MRP protein subunit POP5 [Methanobacterium aggregans]
MKLKILPPTLRVKKRYVAFEVISQAPLKRDDVIFLIGEASQDLYGACGTSRFDLWIVKLWKCHSNPNETVMKGIFRCNRDELESVMGIIPTITRFRGRRIVFHTLGISGTIKSAIKKFIKP